MLIDNLIKSNSLRNNDYYIMYIIIMGGGLIQLAAIGAEDLYLTNDPQITYFKIIYRRYTNFAIEAIPQYFTTTTPDFGQKVTCTITRNADLISKTYLIVDLPAIPQFVNANGSASTTNVFAWINKIGYMMLNAIELEIGGQIIDRQWGDWLNIWQQLTAPQSPDGLYKMIGQVPELTSFTNGKAGYRLYIPLSFYFCKYNGLALPLVALHYSTIKIHIEFMEVTECYKFGPQNSIQINQSMVTYEPYEFLQQTVNGNTVYGQYIGYDVATQSLLYNALNGDFVSQSGTTTTFDYTIYGLTSNSISTPVINSTQQNINIIIPQLSISSAFLLVNYIYLDNQERLRFAKSSHEYLIEQLLIDPDRQIYSNNLKIKLGFNHPCKELVFRAYLNYIGNGALNDKSNYTTYIVASEGNNIIKTGTLLLNGNERFYLRTGSYFNWVQVYQSHTNDAPYGVNVYSFALNPEEHQPSGSLNFSKIDDISLQLSFDSSISYNNPGTLRTYALVYNVLRLINGLGGLAFSN